MVVSDREGLDGLVQATGGQPQAQKAPLMLVLADRGLLREYAVKDAMIAASFVMLAATSLGLATSPMNGWDEAEVKKVIGVDDRDDLAIALLMPVGYPAEERRHPGRRDRAHNVFWQRYGPRAD